MNIKFLFKIKKFSDLIKISRSKKYLKILESINQFKTEDSQKKNSRKRRRKRRRIFNTNFLKNLRLKSFKKFNKKTIQLKPFLLKKRNSKKRKESNILKQKINSLFISKKIDENISLIYSTYKKYLIKKKNLQNNFSLNYPFQNIKKYFSNIEINKFFDIGFAKKTVKKNDKFTQKIGIIFYGDHNLTFVSLIINLKNKIDIIGVTEIPIPGKVIGDYQVEDTNELANIALDSINLLELNDSPLLVVLSTSFFNIHTFNASDLKQISLSDSKIQSKSPYLPSNTLVDFLRMSDKQISNSLIRTIYSKKDLIKSWTDTLQIIDRPIIGLIPAATHIFDAISLKTNEEKIVLIDIESTTTNLLIGSKLADLTSHKLPYGYSLYLNSDLKTANKDYFSRLKNSVNLIFKETKNKIPLNSYVMGSGVDKLISNECELPDGFTSICELNLSDHYYQPQKMSIHEVISDSIETKIYSLTSILTSCV